METVELKIYYFLIVYSFFASVPLDNSGDIFPIKMTPFIVDASTCFHLSFPYIHHPLPSIQQSYSTSKRQCVKCYPNQWDHPGWSSRRKHKQFYVKRKAYNKLNRKQSLVKAYSREGMKVKSLYTSNNFTQSSLNSNFTINKCVIFMYIRNIYIRNNKIAKDINGVKKGS